MYVQSVDGFDMVGKTAVIKELSSGYAEVYHPDYEIYDKYRNRNDAILLAYGQIDWLCKGIATTPVIFDRMVPSSYVYSQFYNGNVSYEMCFDMLNKLSKKMPVILCYVCHDSLRSAARIYANDKSHTESFDQFNSFEDYWETYRKFDEAYRSFYRRLHEDFSAVDNDKVKFTEYRTVSNEFGSRVNTKMEWMTF